MAGTTPLPAGGIEKAQKALDLGATPEEVVRLSGGWIKVVNGQVVPAEQFPGPREELPPRGQQVASDDSPANVPTPADAQRAIRATDELLDPVDPPLAEEPPVDAPVDLESPETMQQAATPQVIAGQSVPDDAQEPLPAQPVNVAPEAPQEAAEQPEEFEDPSVQQYFKRLTTGVSRRPIGYKEEEPGALVQLGAAITALSPTKALYDEATSAVFPDDPEFNFYDHYDEVKKTVHPDYLEGLAGAGSKAELDHRIQQIADEQHAMQTIFAGNKVVGGAAMIGALLADPLTLATMQGEVALLRGMASASRMKNAVSAGAVTATSVGVQESIVANARETVTADDVVAGMLIGGGLGMGIGAALRPLQHADLLQDVRRISSEVREDQLTRVNQPLSDSPGSGYTATLDDLPPRRFERRVVSESEDRVQVARDIRQRTQELQAQVNRLATGKRAKQGLRQAKATLAKAREEVAQIARLPGRPGQKAARQRLQAAERAVDEVMEARQSSRAAGQAAKELQAFRRMTRPEKIAALYGEEGAPRIVRGGFEETEDSRAAREAAIQQREQAAQAAEEQAPGGGSVGAARADTEESPIDMTLQQRDIIDDAEDWVARNGDLLDERLNSKTGKSIQGLGKAGLLMDSTFFLKARSAVAKHFGATFLENGAGLGGRENTAAVLKQMFEQRLLSRVMVPYRLSYKAWAKAQGIKAWELKRYYGSGKTKFDGLLRRELEGRRLARSDDPISKDQSIIDAANAWQKATDEALELMKQSGVRGADEIERIPGYVPLRWRGDKLRKMADSERDAYRALLAKNYAHTLGIPTEDANVIANAVFQRAMKKELQLDTNPTAMLTGDARAELRAMLEESGLHAGKLEELLKRIDNRVEDRGRFQNLRRRNEVDLVQVVQGRSLLDLVNNDMDVLATRYMSETSGRSAMARKGIRSEADWDTLSRTVVQDMVAKDPSVSPQAISDRLEAVHSQMLGRPVGEGVNRNMRRLMDLATLSMLGQVGFAQLAELGTVAGQLGMREILSEVPEMKRFLRSARLKELDQDLVDDIDSLSGSLGDEHLLYRPEVRLEDAAGDDQAWLRGVDKFLAGGMDVLGYASGMNHIKRLEQRLATKILARRVGDLAMGRNSGRLTPERLADIGWEPAKLERIKQMIRKHAEFEGGEIRITDAGVTTIGNPKLARLHMERWEDPQLVEDFAVGFNRFVHQVVQRPLTGETAPWMHRTLGAMFTQFRHFPLVANEKQLARNTMHHDQATFYTATYGLMWSGVAYIAKQTANAPGQEEGWLEDRLTADKIAKGAIQYSGMAAMIPDGISVLSYAGVLPAEWAFNPGHTGGHKQSRLGLQVVPALGAAEDLFNTVTTPTRALWDDYEIGKKDVQALQGATVLGNILPANIAFGLLKQAAE